MTAAQVYTQYMDSVVIILRSYSPVIIVSLALTLVAMFSDFAHGTTFFRIPFSGITRLFSSGSGSYQRGSKKFNKSRESSAADSGSKNNAQTSSKKTSSSGSGK